ncbi:MAG: hypothetical protein D6772_17050 [Bacteroidetes bacterium]|nr:MAG: hypothetical protein D6772_17050 [Bacteroidota bacterium]
MAGFWQKLFKLGQSAETSSPHKPAIHELLKRTADEQADYTHWKNSFVARRLLDWLGDQYAIFLHQPADTDIAIDFLDTPSSKGFVIHFHQTNYSRREATYLFDLFKEKVAQLNYRVQLSDTRTFARKHWVETIEKHYLKPRHTYVEGEPLDQQFGNVMIELELRDDQVNNLRFRATHYSDRNYQEPQSFRELMQVLLG